ncbi:MAG: methyltransferase domain-containing protein [Thermoplasmata archaeon]|nr:methyltransferase domain-containing protein [Thermoplasmata archaeon]
MGKDDVIKLIARFGYSFSKVDVKDIGLYYKLYEKTDVENKRFYNIGAGSFRHPAWTNIDYYSEHYKKNPIDINYNLLEKKPLPILDKSANIVYSSHTVEHINNDAAQHMFNEAYRILKKNKFIRITAPDVDLHYQSILHKDRYFWKWHLRNVEKNIDQISLKQLFLSSFASQTSAFHPAENTYKISDKEFDEIFAKHPYEEALNYCISKCSTELQQKYPHDHINWWNKEKLSNLLRNAGFKTIYNSGYGQSLCPVLRNTVYFDNTHPALSLYVEAQK